MSNFYQVDAGVWRGPRPQPVDFDLIKSKFLAVLSLEGLAEDIKEQKELSPVTVLSFPISFWEIYFTGITQQKLRSILDAIEKAPKPLLVHCQHGQDRTGLVIAAYRVRHGWTKDAAMEEALKFGYRDWINLGLKQTWEKFVA